MTTTRTDRFPQSLLLEGDMTDGDDMLLLEGDMTGGGDILLLQGDAQFLFGSAHTTRVTSAPAGGVSQRFPHRLLSALPVSR